MAELFSPSQKEYKAVKSWHKDKINEIFASLAKQASIESKGGGIAFCESVEGYTTQALVNAGCDITNCMIVENNANTAFELADFVSTPAGFPEVNIGEMASTVCAIDPSPVAAFFDVMSSEIKEETLELWQIWHKKHLSLNRRHVLFITLASYTNKEGSTLKKRLDALRRAFSDLPEVVDYGYRRTPKGMSMHVIGFDSGAKGSQEPIRNYMRIVEDHGEVVGLKAHGYPNYLFYIGASDPDVSKLRKFKPNRSRHPKTYRNMGRDKFQARVSKDRSKTLAIAREHAEVGMALTKSL